MVDDVLLFKGEARFFVRLVSQRSNDFNSIASTESRGIRCASSASVKLGTVVCTSINRWFNNDGAA